MSTQRARVLTALRRRGADGITAADFLPPVVIDGGPPILRLPSRVDELRQAGHRITTRRSANRLARYVLEASPVPEETVRVTAAAPEQLDVSSVSPSSYDPAGDWA